MVPGVSKWKYMDVSNIHDISETHEEGWEYEETVDDDFGYAIIIPAGCERVGVTVLWDDGTYTVQATTDGINRVKTDTNGCTWVDWDLGSALAANAQDMTKSCVTAIRLVSVGGASTIFVNAK